MMSGKVEVLSYDREKRVYKDAYVDQFRKVRHFPALAAIGGGRSDSQSIILVQETAEREPASIDTPSTDTNSKRWHNKLDDVGSRLMPLDSLDAMFESTPPLTSFRTAVMCKHTNARHERERLTPTPEAAGNNQSKENFTDRYGVPTQTPFKPSSSVEAKQAIQRKITYDSQPYSDRSAAGRSLSSKDGAPQWSYNNPTLAKEDIRTKPYFNVPPEGVIKADRKYTREFIRKNVEAYQASRYPQQQQQT